jgi:UDPglucose 6-dehydrogenase
MRSAVASGQLCFDRDLGTALSGADFVFVCVPTPSGPDGEINLSMVLDACRLISLQADQGTTIVIKSTLPVGGLLQAKKAADNHEIRISYNPEFLRQGSSFEDFLTPTRIVIGAEETQVQESVASLYEGFPGEIILTNGAGAELIKLASNAYLATRLSFANDLALLCEKAGASFSEVSLGTGLDPRIGLGYFTPGPGWGGSCLPKDSSGLVISAQSLGVDMPVVSGAIDSNARSKEAVVQRVEAMLDGQLQGRRIAVWGVSFKPDTADLRGSPAVEIVSSLKRQGASVIAYDPGVKISDNPDIVFAESALSAVEGADALVVLTGWQEFREVSADAVNQAMTSSLVLDCRGTLDSNLWNLTVDLFQVLGEPEKPGLTTPKANFPRQKVVLGQQ